MTQSRTIIEAFGGTVMQSISHVWCNLIGVSDPAAVSITTGILAAGLLIFCIWLVLRILGAIFRAMYSPEMNRLMGHK
jgi:hypothetical protein